MKRNVLTLILLMTFILNFSNVNAKEKEKYLDKNSIKILAEYHINEYLESELDEEIIITDNEILLDDVTGKEIAYLVPFANEKGEQKGFMIIDSRINGYGVCEVNYNVEELDNILEKSTNEKLVYIFPNRIKTETEIKLKMKESSENKNIEKYILPESSALNIVDNIKIQSRKLNLINNNINKNIVTTDSTHEIVMLSGNPDLTFVPIKDGSKTYYGCNQAWFSSELGNEQGCGTAAAANIAYHMAAYVQGCSNLYKYSTSILDRPYFINHMEDVYDYVTPHTGILPGIPGVNDIKNKFLEYARSKNVYLYARTYDNPSYLDNIDKTSDFIKEGLSIDSPVAMMQHDDDDFTGDLNNFNWHWTTITKYFRNNATDDRFIAISSWGERYSFNLKLLVDAYPNTYIYFKKV